MEHLVIVRADAPDHFIAQAWGIPEIRGEANTEAGAIDQVRQSLVSWFATARLVPVTVEVNGAANPWLDTFGRSANDPEFPQFLEELQRAREVKNDE